MPVPQYMQKGSKGPHVSLLHAFLCGNGSSDEQIIFDNEYGNVTAAAVAEFQTMNGLEIDGNFGPATRAAAKKNYNFDFEAACECVPGMTEFVQPDGSVIRWWPGTAEKIATERRAATDVGLSGAELG